MAKARNAAHAEEKAEVEVLFAEAVKSGELAKKLRALQASLEGGGRTVRDAIGPVHSNTREHQIMIQSMLGSYTKFPSKLKSFQTLTGLMRISRRFSSLVRTKGKRKGSYGLGTSCGPASIWLFLF